MQQLKILVLTDHTNHSKENSLYALVQAMRKHPLCAQLDVATRGFEGNHLFFENNQTSSLFACKTTEDFAFSADGEAFNKKIFSTSLRNYEVVWLRMPPPLSKAFLDFLIQEFPDQLIINDPAGIYKTGSKAFLVKFPDLCPPMKICTSIADIKAFKNKFPIVLKPFRDYGGRGIVRIDGATVWDGKEQMTFDDFTKKMEGKPINYLGVKFLKRVGEGDKRIIVVNGKIMGASLRLPAKDSWLCNVAMGGSSHLAEVTAKEVEMVQQINPVLSKMGIVMYGLDTLVADNGERVLSEINTTSIGGLPQIAQLQGKPLVQEATDLMWNYITKKMVTA